MFNLKNFKLVNKLKNIDIKANWIKFANSQSDLNSSNNLIDSLAVNNKFVEEDLKLRKMVEEMLVKEFSEEIKNKKSYNFLVDSVVNKLKEKQLGKIEAQEEII